MTPKRELTVRQELRFHLFEVRVGGQAWARPAIGRLYMQLHSADILPAETQVLECEVQELLAVVGLVRRELQA